MKKKIAKELLDIKAVSLVDTDHLFTWASGIKSPIYCDNRMTMSYPKIRAMIADAFAEYIKNNYADVDVIAGTATAGIPHAAWVAERLDKPMIYIRSSAKGHGKSNQIEGLLRHGQKVLVIEDLISTGGSSLKAVDAVNEAGGEVIAVGAIFTYNFIEADDAFKVKNVPYFTLTDYKTLLSTSIEHAYVNAEVADVLAKWSDDPRMFTK